MKRKIYNLVIVLLMIIGLGVISYPYVSNFINQYQQDKIAYGYAETVSGISQEEIDAMWQRAVQYNEDLLKDEIIVDPFDQVTDRKANVSYEETLNPQNNGVIGTIEIPKIDVNLPFYHGTEEDVLQKGIGHLEQTSFPIGGAGTHAVLSGHRGLPSAKLFTDLNLLVEGDVFYIKVLGQTLAYQVDQIKTVEPNQLEDLAIISGEDHVTLVTCTPYAINSHRLLVRGTRIPYEEVINEQDTTTFLSDDVITILPFVAGIATVVIGVMIIMFVRKRKSKRSMKNKHEENK